MSLTIISPGLQATLQDGGRHGYQSRGITTGGALDCHAFAWANRLLHNRAAAAQIEVCYGNFRVRFEKDTRIAIAGADLDWRLNNVPLPLWRSHVVAAGSELSAASPRSGLRSYVAIAGGFQAPEIMGSCATVTGDGLGGLGAGKVLQSNDQIPYKEVTTTPLENESRVPKKFTPNYDCEVQLRVIPGNQFELFSPTARQQFFNQRYQLSNRSDRMGCRMEGNPITDLPGNMVSEGVALGAIQVPSDGLPIVLLNDRQTIGGYPKLGSVYTVDVPALAQCKPSEAVQFVLGSLQQAQAELRMFKRFFEH